ncbi:TolC family protein [Chitinophaga oryzae]|uniref:TolC family protein n=1 Tax=Chitinophaga oryzae TaxID=2725414 RepID=A0ABX6LB01_9BACT|nr:TolC family protein [Chitinophaga oryzae]QJB37248.1 TolC family protein [Chitinophaga oryzae]
MWGRFLIFTLLLQLPVGVTGQVKDTVRISMQEVFSEVDKTHPSLRFYQSKIAAVHSLVEGAKAWMPPMAILSLDRFSYRFSMMKEKTPDNQAGIMLSVQQMIPNAAKLNAKRDYLVSLENVQRNDWEWQKNVLHFAAKLYYYRRYIAEKKLNIIREYRELLQLLLKTAKEKYTYNQADLPTIFKAEASQGELNNMEAMLLSQANEGNIGLNTLMNHDVNTTFSIDTLLVLKDYSIGYLQDLDSSGLLRNDILAVDSRIRSMKFSRIWVATSSKPDFGIQVSHGQMFGMPNQFSVMGMITIPVVPWSSKMYKSEVSSMGFEIEAMQMEKATMQLMVRQMIREKIVMLLYEKKQLDGYDNTVLPAYHRNFETSLVAYRQNTGSFFVLLDAWNMLLMKELERMDKLGQVFTIQSEYEYQKEIK